MKAVVEEKERTMIYLRKDQKEWLKRHALNLSAFIRQKLDEEIEKWKKVEQQK